MSLKDAIKGAGSGARGAKFEKIGAVIGGEVISAELIQDRDDDGKPATWDDGNPKNKIRIIVQTDLDEGDDDQGRPDDGKRALYIKWWGLQRKAFLEALTKAGDADDVLPGGKFFAKYKGDGEKVKKAWSAPKILVYKYVPPTTVPADDFDEDDAPPPAKVAKPAVAKAAPAKAAAKATPKAAPVEDDLADTDLPVDDTASALSAAGLADEDF